MAESRISICEAFRYEIDLLCRRLRDIDMRDGGRRRPRLMVVTRFKMNDRRNEIATPRVMSPCLSPPVGGAATFLLFFLVNDKDPSIGVL
jgi:hypothetical protein